MDHKITYVTAKGLERLENELLYLKTVKRAELAQHLRDTTGDEEDNEHLLALEEQAFVEGRIQELVHLLTNVQLIHPGSINGYAQMGRTVVIRENGTPLETYTIVGSAEANPKEGLISNESPLGKALIGRKAGEDVEIMTPGGEIIVRLVAVQ
jgi:transcription elongation factor GreA